MTGFLKGDYSEEFAGIYGSITKPKIKDYYNQSVGGLVKKEIAEFLDTENKLEVTLEEKIKIQLSCLFKASEIAWNIDKRDPQYNSDKRALKTANQIRKNIGLSIERPVAKKIANRLMELVN